MSELFRPSQSDVIAFMKTAGHPIDPSTIARIYPGVFSDRRVFKYYDVESGDRVMKVRPNDQKAHDEVEAIRKLVRSYTMAGAHFRDVTCADTEKFLMINMPWMGYDLGELSALLDLQELGQLEEDSILFSGFTPKQVRSLINQLETDHFRFTKIQHLVHGDLFQREGPNNIVYHPFYNRLFLIDAEALAEINDDRSIQFFEQIGTVTEWMFQNLLIEDTECPPPLPLIGL